MDLKKYKYIKNTRPQYDPGKEGFQPSNFKSKFNQLNQQFGSFLSKYGPVAMKGLDFAKDMFGSFSTKDLASSNQIANASGTSEGSINGITYQRQNAIDTNSYMEELKAQNGANTINSTVSGAKFGSSIAGPIGGAVGGVLGLVGGIFGGNRRKEEMERRLREAKRINERTNLYNRSGANSQGLLNSYYEENDDNSGQILYSANRGKDMSKVWTPTGYKNGHINSMVGKGESIINFNRGTGTLVTKGKKGVDNQPSSVAPGDDNVILGNDTDWTNGVKFSDQAAPLTAQLELLNKFDRAGRYKEKSSLSANTQKVQERELNRRRQPILNALADISGRQQKQHQIENNATIGYYKGGKDKPKFENGYESLVFTKPYEEWVTDYTNPVVQPVDTKALQQRTSDIIMGRYKPFGEGTTVTSKPVSKSANTNKSKDDKSSNNANGDIIPMLQRMIPSAFGWLMSKNQYDKYRNQQPAQTNTYRSNPYAGRALRGLASLRYNIYPELAAIRNAERRGAYAIDNQGGLTAGQRAAARIANTIGTQQNLSQAYANADTQNNKYRESYYTNLLNAGQADRAARMEAAQQDYENYARAHGAKYEGMDTATANMIDQLNNWYGNEFKYRTYKDIANIYRQKLTNDQLEFFNNSRNGKATYSGNASTSYMPTTTGYSYTQSPQKFNIHDINTWGINTGVFKPTFALDYSIPYGNYRRKTS